MATTVSPEYRPAGRLDAQSALQPYQGQWTPREAAHFARRAGFASSPQELERLVGLTMNGAVASYIHFPAPDMLPAAPAHLIDPRRITAADFSTPSSMNGDLRVGSPLPMPSPPTGPLQGADADGGRNPELRAAVTKARNTAYREDLIALQMWWIDRMIVSPAQLQEKMTLFWHGHFTSGYRDKGITPQMMLAQNDLFRANALGDIRALTLAISRDPAMMLYLDTASSGKQHPNENYARELMELFTLGIGNYTETDIRESARAFTGWTLDRDRNFRNAPQRHDGGVKTFLGQTGNFTGDDIIRIIFEQPACSRFFAKRLLEYFLYSQPEPELVEAVAELLRRHNFVLQPVLAVLLRSHVFYSARAYRALVKSPVEFVVGVYRLMDIEHTDKPALETLVRSGQVLFHPPNVKGWDGGAAWINSQTLLTRENFAAAVMRAPALQQTTSIFSLIPSAAVPAASVIANLVLQDDISPAGLAHIRDYLDGRFTAAEQTFSPENRAERVRGGFYLAMAMPAYQLN